MRRLAVPVVAGLAILLAGCGGGSGTGGAPRLDAAAAADLARRSEAVARLLDAGDGCGAREEARRLARAVARAERSGSVPVAVRDEIDPVVAAMVSRIDCEQRESAEQTVPSTGAVETAEGGENDDRKDEKKDGHGRKVDPHDNGHGRDDEKDDD